MDRLVNRYTAAVVLRNLLTWRQMMWPSLASNVANPLLFLFAFGFGLGAFVGEMDGVAYITFIVPGMMAYSAMFAASFETTIGAFARFNLQRTWDATLATPVRLVELLAGELVWAATKAVLAAFCVLVVGALWGGVADLWGALMALPVLAAASLGFAAFGLCGTAHARSWEFFSYFFTFWVTPMFIFSGTFFPIDRFPRAIETIAWLLPMTHLIAVVRPLTTGGMLELGPLLVHLLYPAGLAVAAFWLAHHRLSRRLFD
jgi:lipooligosaccharide transport system permease protein